MECKYVVFKLGEERYGIPIESVERILPSQAVTKLPRTPKMMLGLFDLRGSTIPAIDARLRFDMEASPEDARNFVVVLTPQGRCALRVDEVDGIMNFEDKDIESNSVLLEAKNDRFCHAIGKNNDCLVVLLDPAHVVPENVKKTVAAAA